MDPANDLIYATRLVPHRSMSATQLRLLMVALSCCCVVASLPFILLGAWPVAGFFGLDVALVYLALRAGLRSARAYEEVRLTAFELHLAKVNARGKAREWRFNPAWVRLEQDVHAEFGVQKLALASRGRRVAVAAFLGAEAKARFAGDLTQALHLARRGPVFW